ncbi:MAG: protein kinase [Tannerella sp.]|jgi:serine/threonine-protein kinase|nr:protein kinase [Tannerella sp.]
MYLASGHNLQNGKYKLTKVIGQGGFSITYSGVWTTGVKGQLGTVKTDVPICIKEYFFKDYCSRDESSSNVLVHSETGKVLFDKFKEKLIKEATILSDVHHPYIVNVLEVFEENNTAYIAMEHITGSSLKQMLDTAGVLPEAKVIKYIYQIGVALEFVHQKNILHLDIKPNNILIDKNNNARLIDFGVSKRYDVEQHETSTTMLTLSKGFASIEQYDSEGTQNFSPCPDIYSLGATMYNLLAGEIPTESILRATKPLVKPSELNKKITPKTEAVIMKAMQIDPAKRYQSVKAMISELDVPSYFDMTDEYLIDNEEKVEAFPDEVTEVYNGSSHTAQSPGVDETVVGAGTAATNKRPNIRVKKRKRRILIPLLIFFFAFVGCAVTYLFDADQSKGINQLRNLVADVVGQNRDNQVNTPPEQRTVSPEDENHTTANTNDTKTENTQPSVTGTAEPKPVTSAANNEDTKKNDPKTQAGNTPEVVNTPVSNEKIDAEYAQLIANGKVEMEQLNFAGARKDLTKAKDLKPTEEAIRLLIDLDTKENEKKIADKKAEYVIYENLPLGNYFIARKISTGLFGAVDSKGNEVITCKYLNAVKSKEGRAFEREDNLYDIYNKNGGLAGQGFTTY